MARRFGGPSIARKSLSNSFDRRGRRGGYSGNYDPAAETINQALGAYGNPYSGQSSRPVQLYGRSTDINPRSGGLLQNTNSYHQGGYAGKRPRGFIKF